MREQRTAQQRFEVQRWVHRRERQLPTFASSLEQHALSGAPLARAFTSALSA